MTNRKIRMPGILEPSAPEPAAQGWDPVHPSRNVNRHRSGWAGRALTGAFLGLLLCVAAPKPGLSAEAVPEWEPSEAEPIDLTLFLEGIEHWAIFSPIRDYERIDPADVHGIAKQLLKFQNDDGGWPNHIDWLGKLDPEELRARLPGHGWESSFGHHNTCAQIRFLAEAFELEGEPAYRDAALRGLHYILDAQHARGGWPGSEVHAIAFSEGVMTGILDLLHDIERGKSSFAFLDEALRERLAAALEQGIEVTLACQLRQGERLTGWGQQYDPETLDPISDRVVGRAALASRESAEVVGFLMELESPSDAVRRAVIAAVQWFRQSAILGYGYLSIPAPRRPYHQASVDFDRIFFENNTAPPVWARVYDLRSGSPLLTRRDGAVVAELHELSYERRIGYDWYGYWPKPVLERYPGWLQQAVEATGPMLP